MTMQALENDLQTVMEKNKKEKLLILAKEMEGLTDKIRTLHNTRLTDKIRENKLFMESLINANDYATRAYIQLCNASIEIDR